MTKARAPALKLTYNDFPRPKLVPIYRPQKDGRLNGPRACRALPGIESSPSGVRIQRIDHYINVFIQHPLYILYLNLCKSPPFGDVTVESAESFVRILTQVNAQRWNINSYCHVHTTAWQHIHTASKGYMLPRTNAVYLFIPSVVGP